MSICVVRDKYLDRHYHFKYIKTEKKLIGIKFRYGIDLNKQKH